MYFLRHFSHWVSLSPRSLLTRFPCWAWYWRHSISFIGPFPFLSDVDSNPRAFSYSSFLSWNPYMALLQDDSTLIM